MLIKSKTAAEYMYTVVKTCSLWEGKMQERQHFRLVAMWMMLLLMCSWVIFPSKACDDQQQHHQPISHGCEDCISEEMKYGCPSCVPILRCMARCLWGGSSQAKCVKRCDCNGGKPSLSDCKKCMARCKCSCS